MRRLSSSNNRMQVQSAQQVPRSILIREDASSRQAYQSSCPVSLLAACQVWGLLCKLSGTHTWVDSSSRRACGSRATASGRLKRRAPASKAATPPASRNAAKRA
jgi:hypothetical protein